MEFNGGISLLPFEAPELLSVAHDFAKVDVEHVSAVLQHDVVIVPVTDAQDEGGHAPACTGVDEVHHSLQTEALVYTREKVRIQNSHTCCHGDNLVIVLLGFVPHVEPFL